MTRIPKWADMYEQSSWRDEQHCESVTFVAKTRKAQRDLASYHDKFVAVAEKSFGKDQ